MRNYINKVLNNCAEVSMLSLQQNEVKLPLQKRAEMYVHVLFCKCCSSYIQQSKVIDLNLKKYKAKIEKAPEIKASDALKSKLEKIIEDNL
jgi:hypothetical protein